MLSLSFHACFFTKQYTEVYCFKNLPKHEEPCDLEHWENLQLKDYKNQNWRNFLDD